MTIIRAMHPVKIKQYTTTVDDYGQKRQGASNIVYAQAAIYPYSVEQNNNPEYKDVIKTAFVTANITECNELEDGTERYLVQKVLPAGRYNQLLLKKA